MRLEIHFLALAAVLFAQPATRGSRGKAYGMFELKPPKGIYTLLFQNVIGEKPAKPEGALWTKLAVRSRSGETIVVEDFAAEESGSAVSALEDERNRWSPDGRFLVVVISSGVTVKGEVRQQTYRFVDLEAAEWVTFRAGDVSASTNNFVGWKPDTDHTMWIISGKTKREAHPEE